MTEREAATRRALTRLAAGFRREPYNRGELDEHTAALLDIHPRHLEQAVTDAIRIRTTRPMPVQLRELAEHHADEEHRQRHAGRTIDEGVGCPTCLEQYPPGRHAKWLQGGPDLAACTEHNHAWRGHLPPEPDPGDLPADVWRHLALRGDYGQVIQRAAQRGATPAETITTITTNLDTELRNERPAA